MTEHTEIEIIGATANNLRSLDCTFPFPGLTVIVGVSGSGKSSLLRETLATEAARRNALFLGHGHRGGSIATSVEAFIGSLPAALHVGQRPFRASARTTVGTASGILAEFRRLFMIDGAPFSAAGIEISQPSPEQYADWISRHYRGTAIVWAVPLRWQPSDGVVVASRLRAAGFESVILRSETDRPAVHERGRSVGLKRWKPLNPAVRHALEVEVGRIVVSGDGDREELRAVIRKAWEIAGPDAIVELPDAPPELATGPLGHQLDGRRDWVDPDESGLFRAPDQHLLSFNAPDHADSGACPKCHGLGRIIDLDEKKLVADPALSLRDGALALWTPKAYKHINIQHETIEALAGRCGFAPDLPWAELTQEARHMLLDGTGNEWIQGIDWKTGRKQGAPRPFEGFRAAILRRWESSLTAAQRLGEFVKEGDCPVCRGSRWSRKALALRVANLGLAEWLAMTMAALERVCHETAGTDRVPVEAAKILRRIAEKASVFRRLGLGHIACDRGMSSISDGEARRLQIGSVLSMPAGRLLLLLDEPARGLHEADLHDMIGILKTLATHHAVIVNEHRDGLVAAADRIVELGPGAGPLGGRLVSTEPRTEAVYQIRVPKTAKAFDDWIEIDGASLRTVRDQNLRLPIGCMTAVVGVSGSGKSSFVNGILVPALARAGISCEGEIAGDGTIGRWQRISGAERIGRIHILRQRVPPRNKRSLVATMTGALDSLARAFAALPEAKSLELAIGDFRLNGGEGRCPDCLGTGEILRDEVGISCLACGGRRYGPEVLTPRLAGLDIAETLASPASDLLAYWRTQGDGHHPAKLEPLLEAMIDLGVGHVALGRKLDSLSGGEVQRLRIARLLADGRDVTRHLFILDEPATGLHRQDTERLLGALRRMVDGGRNTVLVVEHNLHLVAQADWLIEFGPGAGDAGGRVVAQGSPDVLAGGKTPTGQALAGSGSLLHSSPTGVAAIADMVDNSPALLAPGILARIEQGDDATVPSPELDLSARLLGGGRRLWEIGDLHLEVAKLAIDDFRRRFASDRERLLARWQADPAAILAINPLTDAVRTWGNRLPKSRAKEALARAERLGLSTLPDLPDITVDEARLRPAGIRTAIKDSGLSKPAELARALAMGGGYAELRSPAGDILETLAATPMKPEDGWVAPARLEPAHLSRLADSGRCVACGGAGVVRATAPELLVRDVAGEPEVLVSAVLTTEAEALFKGLWRTDAVPFFRHFEKEGLDTGYWREILLDGYWVRPGAGTFLKKPKADPEKVESWLRWDGLFRLLWSELPRSRHGAWVEKIRNASVEQSCTACGGSGHRPVIHLLSVAGRTLADWIAQETVDDFTAALRQAGELERDARRIRTRDRILACLDPLAGQSPNSRLGKPADESDPLHRQFADKVLRAFMMIGVGP